MPLEAPSYGIQSPIYQKEVGKDLLFLLTLKNRVIPSVLFFASKYIATELTAPILYTESWFSKSFFIIHDHSL